MSDNKLRNSSFEGSWFHPVMDGAPIQEFQIPDHWEFWWTEKGTRTPGAWYARPGSTQKVGPALDNPYDGADHSRFVRPEVRILLRSQVPDWEEEEFGMEGDHLLKSFKGSGSIWFKFIQVVAALPAGEYNFRVQVYPDAYKWDSENTCKVFGSDPNTVLVRFEEGGQFQSANAAPDAVDRLRVIEYQFTHAGGDFTAHVEFLMPFAMDNNGVFFDRWELVAVGEPEPPPLPDIPILYSSRLGTHNIAVASEYGDTLALLRSWKMQGGQPAVIKAVSDFGWLAEARAIFPDVPIIGRVTSPIEGAQGVEDPNTNLEMMAFELMGLILEKPPSVLDTVDYWEPVNEPLGGGASSFAYAQLARLMVECMHIANRTGLKLALFSFNAGTPEWNEMVEIVNTGVFSRAKEGGHILALHEGVFNDDPIDKWFGDMIPGSPVVSGGGALCFRYRYLYHLLAQRDEVIPLVVSEFRTHGDMYPRGTTEIVERFAWYDERARADAYFLGVTPFTLGARDQWFPSHDYGRDYPKLIEHAVSVEGVPPVDPPPVVEPGRGQPREQYERAYILLPPDAGHELAGEIAKRYFDAFRPTVGGSADDAGVGNLSDRAVIAVQPQGWGDELEEFYEHFYPGVCYLPAEGDNEYQLMGRILASLLRARGVRLTYPTTHKPPVVTSEFGVDRDNYFHNGLDLRASWAKYQDKVLAAHEGRVIHAGHDPAEDWFGHQVKMICPLPDGSEMQIRYAHLVADSAMVGVGDVVSRGQPIALPNNTGNSTGDHLHIDVKFGPDYADPAILIDWEGDEEPLPDVVACLGLHDDAGGDWMIRNDVKGCLLVHRAVHEMPVPIDMIRFANAGIQVIARWGYDYAGGGTVPPQAQEEQWIQVMAASINNSRGVYLHTIFNEWNNPAEWTGGYPNPKEILTPGRALNLYQRVAALVRPDVLLAPGPVDPFNVVAQEFGQPADPKDWFDAMHNSVRRIDAIVLHAKTQTNNPAECASNEKFSDAPLIGRYLHLRTYLDQLAWVKISLRNLPVLITEVNPQRIDNTRLGWIPDNAAWVTAAVQEIGHYNLTGGPVIKGLCFYRYDLAGDQSGFGLRDKPAILAEIARQAKA